MKTSETENRKTIEKINKTKSWFFEIYKIDNLLARLINNKKKGSLFLLPKMPKGKKAKGKKVALAADIVNQEAKKMVNPLFEKRPPKFWHWTEHPAQRGPHRLCQMAPLHSAAEAKDCSKSLKVPPAINQFTQAFSVPNSYSTT